MVSGLMNVARELAESVAAGLGIRELPPPMPKVMTKNVTPEVSVSPALSLFARPGDGSIRTRRVAIVVADGCDGTALTALADRLTNEGAVPRFVSTSLGTVQPAGGDDIDVDVSFEAPLAVLYDAVVLPDAPDAIAALSRDGRTIEFIKDQYRHCKPILASRALPQTRPLVDRNSSDDRYTAAAVRSQHHGLAVSDTASPVRKCPRQVRLMRHKDGVPRTRRSGDTVPEPRPLRLRHTLHALTAVAEFADGLRLIKSREPDGLQCSVRRTREDGSDRNLKTSKRVAHRRRFAAP